MKIERGELIADGRAPKLRAGFDFEEVQIGGWATYCQKTAVTTEGVGNRSRLQKA